MAYVDLNCDCGEGYGAYTLGDDAAMFEVVTSANVACGFHAGDPDVMAKTFALARQNGVSVGAHPGFHDIAGFGRRRIPCTAAEVERLVAYQIGAAQAMAAYAGHRITYVKTHGALGNIAMEDPAIAAGVMRAIRVVDPDLAVLAVAGTHLEYASKEAGLRTIHEIYADRGYTETGLLAPRGEPGAVLHDADFAAARVVSMVQEKSRDHDVRQTTARISGFDLRPRRYARRRRNGARRAQRARSRGPSTQSLRRMTNAPRFLAAGESALTIEYGRTIDPQFYAQVQALDAALRRKRIEGVLETVPTYRSLMVHFDPRVWSGPALAQEIAAIEVSDVKAHAGKTWHIPACYDAPHCEDLEEAAGLLGLTPEAVVTLHSGATYQIVMYGFAPGFAFIGGLPAELAVSRRLTPRPPAPAGALTIANGQALIASISMPTGWYMLGRTPARTFDPARDPVFPAGIGDRIKFERIDAATFEFLERDAAAGRLVMREGS